MGEAIAKISHSSGPADQAILSLLFAEGTRPDADSVARLAALPGQPGLPFAITHRPAEASWLELLVQGLAFDCRGLAPGESAPRPADGALLGLAQVPEGAETVEIAPGPHLVEAGAMVPVLRIQIGLALRLASLPGLVAVNWQPARSWMEPGYFRKIAGDWIGGGAFPALGLTTLEELGEGLFATIGLGFLVGQEVLLEAGNQLERSAAARIAIRLVHELVTNGKIEAPCELVGPGREVLLAQPEQSGSLLRVTVRA